MPDKTIAIVGAGPGLGFSLAKRFGREGFRVAQITRNRETLAGLTADLANRGIIAEGFADEVTQGETIRQAFREIERRFGQVDVFE